MKFGAGERATQQAQADTEDRRSTIAMTKTQAGLPAVIEAQNQNATMQAKVAWAVAATENAVP